MDEMNEMDDSAFDAEAQDTEDTGGDSAADHERASKTARKLEPVVLAHVLAPKYQPVKPRVIARQLDLPSEQHKALKLAIRRLVKDGKLAYGKGHQVRRPAAPDTNPKRQRGPEKSGQVENPSYEVASDGTRNAPATKKNELVGTFRRASGGYGRSEEHTSEL